MRGKRIISAIESIPHRIATHQYRKVEEQGNVSLGQDGIFTHVTYYSVGNAGDTVLSQCVRRMFQTSFSTKWNLVGVNELVDHSTVSNMNTTDAVIVGGGGLFLPDTNANSISGWQWAISKDCLMDISVPLIGYSIGYNFFPGQKNSQLFIENLQTFCEKAKFIGLRNHGSVTAVKTLLPSELQDKIVYQPCTTTLIRKLYSLPKKSRSNRVAINIAFDRENVRFGDDKELILDEIAQFAKSLEGKGYKIVLVYHMQNDKKIIPYMEKRNVKFDQCDLSFAFPDKVFKFYNSVDLVAGMRGHAQMIPFGLNCEIISLGTHDKMRWFLEDINAVDWYVNLRDDPEHLNDRLLSRFEVIHENNFDSTQKRLIEEQDKLWAISKANMSCIGEIIRKT